MQQWRIIKFFNRRISINFYKNPPEEYIFDWKRLEFLETYQIKCSQNLFMHIIWKVHPTSVEIEFQIAISLTSQELGAKNNFRHLLAVKESVKGINY